MDRQAYIEHARQKLIQESIDMINSWPEDEILTRMQTCPVCMEIEASAIDLEHAITEGLTPEEVDRLINVDAHCDGTDESGIDLDIDDTGVDLKVDSEDDDVDEEIASEFRGAIDTLCDHGDIAFIVAYVYAADGKMSDSRVLKGRTFVFGSKPILDTMINEVSSRMDENMDDDGIVNDLGDTI